MAHTRTYDTGQTLAEAIIAEGERAEREGVNRALLPHEIRAVKAVVFLRKIAPYLFTETRGNVNENGTLSQAGHTSEGQ